MRRRTRISLLAGGLAALLCAGTVTSPTTGVAQADGGSCLVAAAGDVAGADDYATEAAGTAALVTSAAPRKVLAPGDLAYDSGTASEFANYYAPTWGSFKSITAPAPGNHEYRTPGAAGYYGYFGVRANYSFDVCGWHVISVDQYKSMSAAVSYITSDAAAHPGAPLLVQWHEPRYSSGLEHGSSAAMQDLWAAAVKAGAKIVINGHDHHYERFRPMDAAGAPQDGGTREFVTGAGGHHLRGLGTRVPTSEKTVTGVAGVLLLNLRLDGYDWKFQEVDGSVGDSGTLNFSGTTPFTTIRMVVGEPFTDVSGNYWSTETGYIGGHTYDTPHAIQGAWNDQLYQRERANLTGYDIPISEPGTYRVTLKEAEIWYDAAGKRVFDVTAEGITEVSGLDIFDRTGGKYRSLQIVFDVPVTDGVLNLRFINRVDHGKVGAIRVERVGEARPVEPGHSRG